MPILFCLLIAASIYVKWLFWCWVIDQLTD